MTTSLSLEVDYVFPDKHTADAVCGVKNNNLAIMTKSYGVSFERDGISLEIKGDKSADVSALILTLVHKLNRDEKLTSKDFEKVVAAPLTKGMATPKTAGQGIYRDALDTHSITFGIGPAGTGKTRLAIDSMVGRFQRGEVDKIILARPAVEAGERLGFLPGDAKDKLDPYMQPLYDSLNYHFPGKTLVKMMEDKQIEIAPIAFLRGRTLNNAGIVVDEAQNLTEMQMKMVLTRLGTSSSMAITGDIGQIDLPHFEKSGLVQAKQILSNIPGIAFIELTDEDVVRHPLVIKILKAYG